MAHVAVQAKISNENSMIMRITARICSELAPTVPNSKSIGFSMPRKMFSYAATINSEKANNGMILLFEGLKNFIKKMQTCKVKSAHSMAEVS